VTNTRTMFAYCYNLISVPDIDTSNVTDMVYIFDKCLNLEKLNLSSYNGYLFTRVHTPKIIENNKSYGIVLDFLDKYKS
jgi:surface protein